MAVYSRWTQDRILGFVDYLLSVWAAPEDCQGSDPGITVIDESRSQRAYTQSARKDGVESETATSFDAREYASMLEGSER